MKSCFNYLKCNGELYLGTLTINIGVRIIIAIMVAIAIVGNVSMSSISPSTIDISKIDCDKVVYSANWGLEITRGNKTLHRRG
jgi:hypothetical protein